MADLTAQRTLVKSPPELWTELSEVESLAKHLGELGEIRITKVEPESTVAWEGDDVCGTVELEQSGWGTKVTFKATVPEPEAVTRPPADPEPEPVAIEPEPVAVEPASDPEPAVEPEPVAESEPVVDATPRKPGFFARWLFRRRSPEPEATAEPKPAIEPEPVAVEPEPAVEPERIAEEPVPEPEPVPEVAPAPERVSEPEPLVAAVDSDRVQRVLDDTLDALGQAHHRPFSRG